jgi:regulatory protein
MEEIDPAILHYCTYQERCQSEVRNKLYELGFTYVTVEQQLANLISAGVVNEQRFATAYARGKFRMKQWGRVKIKQQLKLKGISDYCIKNGMAEIDYDEYESALTKLADRKIQELAKEKSKLLKKAKLYRYLLQKGYENDLVSNLVFRLLP